MRPDKTKWPRCSTCKPYGNPGSVPLGNQWSKCPECKGHGFVPNGFPVPMGYLFSLTLQNQGVGAIPALSVTSSPAPAGLTGTNPQVLRLANEADFLWLETMGTSSANNLNGSADRWFQLTLTDISAGTSQGFSNAPVDGILMYGTGQLPFAELEPYWFGAQTQLQLQAYAINISNNVLVFGKGDGSTVTFGSATAQILNPPILPGSLTVTDPTGIISGTDNGNGSISGTGISGTINYTTGALSVTYGTAPATGANPTATYTQGCGTIFIRMELWGQLFTQPSGGIGALPHQQGQLARQ